MSHIDIKYVFILLFIVMKIEINLWWLLGENKMTARALSEKTWLSPQQISHIKNWKTTKISFDTIAKFLKAFDCKPNDLFTIVDDNG